LGDLIFVPTACPCPMGVNRWKEAYHDALKGKNILLIPDNDEKGREHMEKVASILKRIVKNIRSIDL